MPESHIRIPSKPIDSQRGLIDAMNEEQMENDEIIEEEEADN